MTHTLDPVPNQLENGDATAVDDYGVKVAVDAAVAATKPHELPDHGRVVITTPPGSVSAYLDIDAHFEKFTDHPRRKRGTYTTATPEALAAYIVRHHDDQTEVWADPVGARVVGIINSHQGNDTPVDETGAWAGWGDHRVEFAVSKTTAWTEWLAADNTLMSQEAFALFIEDHLRDIESPEPTTMLELAQTFEAKNDVTFQSAVRLNSGERQLVFKEDIDARAGVTGQITIPDEFTVMVQPFEGAAGYRIVARLRYRIAEGTLRIGYKLDRPADVLRAAFDDVTEAIATAIPITVPMFHGIPAGPQGIIS